MPYHLATPTIFSVFASVKLRFGKTEKLKRLFSTMKLLLPDWLDVNLTNELAGI